MGQSSSSDRRRTSSYPQLQPSYYSYPQPPPPNFYHHHHHHQQQPPPHPTSYTNSYSYQQLAAAYNGVVRFIDSLMGRANNPPSQQRPPHYYSYGPPYQGHGWWVPSPSPVIPPSSSSSMPQYVEHQVAKTVKSDVNVHKDTIRIDVDEHNPDHYLVSFTFDATVDGSITIYYFAQEGANGDFAPLYVDIYAPKKFPFQKGLGQKFVQPSGSGIDLGFFELDDLEKPLNGEVFPLVVCAEACQQRVPTDGQVELPAASTCAQATQAVIQKANDGSFQAKTVKQVLWANGERYELQEIFGVVNTAEAAEEEAESKDDDADDMGKECVICLSESRNTTVLPCRHMCMCRECAHALRLQSNKCPICRQPIEKLLEINVHRAGH